MLQVASGLGTQFKKIICKHFLSIIKTERKYRKKSKNKKKIKTEINIDK